MERYIDADALVKDLEKSMTKVVEKAVYIPSDYDREIIQGYLLAKNHAIDHVNLMPTADVAPRAEIDKARQDGYNTGKREAVAKTLHKVEAEVYNLLPRKRLDETKMISSFELAYEKAIYAVIRCLNGIWKEV